MAFKVISPPPGQPQAAAPAQPAPQAKTGGWTVIAPPPEASGWDTAYDVGRSVASQFGQGVVDLAGLPGDAQQLVNRGMDWAMGTTPEEQAKMAEMGGQTMPTTDQLRKPIEQATGPFYESKTTPGKYAGAAARFAPSIMAGPGSAGR